MGLQERHGTSIPSMRLRQGTDNTITSMDTALPTQGYVVGITNRDSLRADLKEVSSGLDRARGSGGVTLEEEKARVLSMRSSGEGSW